MQDIMVERPERDFMTIVKSIFFTAFTIFILASIGCSDEFVDGEIPPATFPDIIINLDQPPFAQSLSFDRGYIYLDNKTIGTSVGVRGIILFRVNETTFNAFERNCSYLPYEATSTIEVHSSSSFLIDPGCQSRFSITDGFPTGGPARVPLRRYEVILNGRTLTITDEPIL